MSKRMKLPKAVKKVLGELEAIDIPYEIKRSSRHIQIYVRGMFAGIVPTCVSGDGQVRGNGEKNVIAQIRRVAKGGVVA